MIECEHMDECVTRTWGDADYFCNSCTENKICHGAVFNFFFKKLIVGSKQ